MTAKRALPLLPNADHLRKQAKARLALLRQAAPAARLAEAQMLIAQEYGFADWRALQAEVARRAAHGPSRIQASIRAPLYRARSNPDGILDHEADVEAHMVIFRTGLVTQAGFILIALIGLSFLFISAPHAAGLHTAIPGVAVPLITR